MKFLIALFPMYRFFYNLEGHIQHFFGYWGNFHLVPWIDLKIWRKHPEHPSNKPWVKDIVRRIYFQTGIMPKLEHQHLLEE